MSPFLLFTLLIGGIYGAAFHIWKGQQVRDLAFYVVVGVIGFALGQLIGNRLGLNLFLIGPVHIFEASLVSWFTLFVGRWLKV
jgi:uncharacterized membrane protein YeaQ/YmgE (transglycosylase-associated protein family)